MELITALLVVVMLGGCSNKSNSEKTDTNENTSQISSKRAESKQRLAKLKSENAALKKKESESAASSSIKAASESLEAASSSTRATSESIEAASSSSATESSSESSTTKLLSEDELPWGGMGQRPGFDVSLQEYTDKGLTLAGFKLISGTVYGVYFEGSDFPTITVDVSTGNVSKD